MNQDIKASSQTSVWQLLKVEDITLPKIKPGDFIIPDQTFQDQYKRTLFTQGKEYVVLAYANHTLGINCTIRSRSLDYYLQGR